jgi:hypothetical protein
MAGFDHTLITRRASVGGIAQKRTTRVYLESATYDWFGLPRTGRNGFDSRWRYHVVIDLQAFRSHFGDTTCLCFYAFLYAAYGLLTR